MVRGDQEKARAGSETIVVNDNRRVVILKQLRQRNGRRTIASEAPDHEEAIILKIADGREIHAVIDPSVKTDDTPVGPRRNRARQRPSAILHGEMVEAPIGLTWLRVALGGKKSAQEQSKSERPDNREDAGPGLHRTSPLALPWGRLIVRIGSCEPGQQVEQTAASGLVAGAGHLRRATEPKQNGWAWR